MTIFGRARFTIDGEPEVAIDRHPGKPVTLDPALRRRLTSALIWSAPAHAKHIVVRVSAVASMIEASMTAQLYDGTSCDGDVSDDVIDLIEEIRDDSFRTGVGTWYHARFALHSIDPPIAVFDHKSPPRMLYEDEFEPADDEVMLADHRVFPRDVEHLPAWHPAYLEAHYPQPLVDAAVAYLRRDAPPGWRQLTMTISAAIYYTESTITTVTTDETTTTLVENVLDPRVVSASRRVHLARHGCPWYTAEVTLAVDGEVAVSFDDHRAPFGGLWSTDHPAGDAHPEMLRIEQERIYVADVERLPAWHPSRARAQPVHIRWLEAMRLGVMAVVPSTWQHLVIELECLNQTVRASIRDLAAPEHDYGHAFEADEESVNSVNILRRDAAMSAEPPGSWYSARFVMDQPDHPHRIVVDDLDFHTQPFTKISRAGDDLVSNAHHELMLADHRRYPRENADLPAWHPQLQD